ncbi:hypothetical protein PBI_NESBITT_49 [Streptomyces phage Nesbitt]|uniref:Uncharacterized protein n=1 Tax=Streptomyces phage Nesbitt TaxID=2108133 RepID=A0A2P1JT38_9CAUD|nr:hypothetical protein PBI_NESBITT_49 [Streptomyces phage Nesbitt]
MTYFIRTENGVAANVTKEVALAEANDAMMSKGRGSVAQMTAVTDFYDIRYKGGRKVTLSRQTGDMPELEPTEEPTDVEPKWSVASHRMLLHRFTQDGQDGRALCNKSFRPYKYANGYNFETRTARDAGEYGDLYTYCPRCAAK